MAKIKFLWNNLFDLDAGALTVSSEATGFPKENLQHRWHTRHWRSTGVVSEWVKRNLGAAYNVYFVIIKYHNFQVGATLKFQAHADDAHWADPDVNETITVTSDIIVKLFSSAQNYQWWRITIDDAGNPDGYLKAGRIYIGGYFEPAEDFRHNEIIPIDPSTKKRSTGGQYSSDQKERYKEFVYNFGTISESDKDTMLTIFDKVGISLPYFICEDSDYASTKTYYIQNKDNWHFVNIPQTWDDYTLSMTVEEMR